MQKGGLCKQAAFLHAEADISPGVHKNETGKNG